jgi:uncharacterized protein (DUF433 family)
MCAREKPLEWKGVVWNGAMATATKTAYAHIVKEAGYCGGKAAIENTRVRVMNVVFLHKQGTTPDEILAAYPHLSLALVHAALAYDYDHVDEIEAELSRNGEGAERFEVEKAADIDHAAAHR